MIQDKSMNLKDKYTGCLIGLACGDYLGLPFEYKSPAKVREYFKTNELVPLNGGNYSDDTAQMICLAESLIEKGFDTEDQLLRYKKWLFEGYASADGKRSVGVCQHTFRVLSNIYSSSQGPELINDPEAGGNGALMRCSPVALWSYPDKKLLIDLSLRSAYVTHNNLIAAWSCVVLNIFIFYSLKGENKRDFCRRVLKESIEMPVELVELLRLDFSALKIEGFETSGYSLNTLKIALFSFLTTNNFSHCLTKAIAMGGDTDTQASVAGALAGAYYGNVAIPKIWSKTLVRNHLVMKLSNSLYKLNSC